MAEPSQALRASSPEGRAFIETVKYQPSPSGEGVEEPATRQMRGINRQIPSTENSIGRWLPLISLAASRQSSFPRGGSLILTDKFTGMPKALPLGELLSKAKLRGRGC